MPKIFCKLFEKIKQGFFKKDENNFNLNGIDWMVFALTFVRLEDSDFLVPPVFS